MTGLECLKQEMVERGCTKAQLDSKVVPIILDIISGSGTKYTDYSNLQIHVDDLHAQVLHLENRIKNLRMEKEEAEHYLNKVKERASDYICSEWREMQEYIDKFYAALNECETAEMRDNMRCAQTFVNSVDVDTKYDNTAFIVGLAAILSNGGINGIDELHKINPKIPPASPNKLYAYNVSRAKYEF